MGYYKDLREYIAALEAKDKLVRIKEKINKDTELMPLVKWQFRGLPEEERKAFMFENVVDVKGRKYDIPVLIACHAASRDVYAMAMMCNPDDILEKWSQAQVNPIEPKIIETGPVHEKVYQGDALLEHGDHRLPHGPVQFLLQEDVGNLDGHAGEKLVKDLAPLGDFLLLLLVAHELLPYPGPEVLQGGRLSQDFLGEGVVEIG